MTSNLFNFFILTKLPRKEVLHFSTSPDLQEELTTIFRKQQFEFLSNCNEIPYEPCYKPNEDELFKIEQFSQSLDLLFKTRSPSSIETFDPLIIEPHNIKALFSTSDHPNELLFQNSNTPKVYSCNSLKMSWDKKRFSKMEKPSIVSNENLCVILRGDNLLFKSSSQTNKIFDLKPYLKEATYEQVIKFNSHPHFSFSQKDFPYDKWMLLRICMILESGVLDIPVSVLVYEAAQIERDLKCDNNGKIILPNDKKSYKDLLCFLAEEIMQSPLTKKLHLVNSKRTLLKS